MSKYIYYTREGKFEASNSLEVPYNKLYREDGPSLINSVGTEFWVKDGDYHREDGPAIVYPNSDVGEIWRHGRFYSKIILSVWKPGLYKPVDGKPVKEPGSELLQKILDL